MSDNTDESVDLSHIALSKLYRREEFDFVTKCREVISELTGEDFTVGNPSWLKYATMQLYLDGYCERLKMAINYEPVLMYKLPQELHSLYDNPNAYRQFVTQIAEARFVATSMNGVAVLSIPHVMDDVALRTHLLNQLHALTKFRVWVGSPRCKCPSKMAYEQ